MTTGPVRWSLATRVLHWLSAACIATMLVLGVYMVWFVDDAARRFDLYQRHKALGVFVFALAAARITVRAATRSRGWPHRMSRLHRAAAGGAHAALYALMFAATLTGYAMVSTSPLPLPLALPGGWTVPNLLAADYAASERWKIAHHACVLALGLLAAGHAGVALWRHFVDRDDVLSRMGFGKRAASP
ncbi:MAG TPA: cytochrome b [Roseiarcus sp.]|nr:cytochrome b [Roseiarcus sp.]